MNYMHAIFGDEFAGLAERMNMGVTRPALFASRLLRHSRFLIVSVLFILLPSIAFAEPPHEINFGHEAKYGRFFPFNELESWATGRNLVVLPDCPLRDMRDGESEIIPAEGMSFELSAPRPGRVYLYLDMVVFRPAAAYNPLLDGIHCVPGADTVRMESPKVQDVKQVRWLTVEVNGKILKTVYVGGDEYLRSPLVIQVEREVLRDGKLKVRLLVSPGEGFFSIWDAFVSASPDG